MSESAIDAYRVASVLGYCLLPMVGIGAVSVMIALEYVLLLLLFVLRANLSNAVAWWATSFRLYPFSGVRILHRGFLWLFCACRTKGYWLPIQLDCYMVALHY